MSEQDRLNSEKEAHFALEVKLAKRRLSESSKKLAKLEEDKKDLDVSNRALEEEQKATQVQIQRAENTFSESTDMLP